jgi:hypothetical protein
MRILKAFGSFPETIRRPPGIARAKEQNCELRGGCTGLLLSGELREFGNGGAGAGTEWMGKDKDFGAAAGSLDCAEGGPSKWSGIDGSSGLIEPDQSLHPNERRERRKREQGGRHHLARRKASGPLVEGSHTGLIGRNARSL